MVGNVEQRLKDRVAVVTGAASGIGRASALRFADEGADIVIGDFNAAGGAETAAMVEERGRRALFVETDTADEQAVDALAQATRDTFGRADILLAAAGVSGAPYYRKLTDPNAPPASFKERFLVNLSKEDWDRVLGINLTGVWMTDRAFVRIMMEQESGGAIINIASSAAAIPLAAGGDYCVSKAGVSMLTKVLALETLRYGIRVNAIGPGYTDTPMSGGRDNEAVHAYAMSLTPMKRYAQPAEMASMAAFLASDESSFITGETYFVDGGQFTG